MDIRRCGNCMNKIEGRFCSRCGFDQESDPQVPYGLRRNTVLQGRYLIGKLLGQGGFGLTYVGYDQVLDRKVAVKEYFPMGQAYRDTRTSNQLEWPSSLREDGQWQNGSESFLKEARKMAKVDEIPELVRVRDTFYENETAYIVMDFIEGVTLRAWLQTNGQLGFRECLQLLEPLLKGLSRVHAQGIIHRDISPDNIMVRPDGRLCLLDLGAAKDLTLQKGNESQLVTKQGFSPMEQYTQTGQVGTWTDVYAVCATIYYCMTGCMVPGSLDRSLKDTLDLGLHLQEPLTEEAEWILRAGLAVHPEDRIQTIDALLQAFRNGGWLKTEQMKEVEPERKKKKRKEKKKGRRIGVMLAGIFLIAVGSGAVVLSMRSAQKTVEVLGNTNSNLLNDGAYGIIPKKYEYFLDHENNLYVCTYDKKEQTFYIDEGKIVAEQAFNILLGNDEVYFLQITDEEEGEKSICRMNPDGSRIKPLLEDGVFHLMQYTRLSDGREYLYVLQDEKKESLIMRLNLESGETQEIARGEILWYNVYGSSVYYTAICEDGTELIRTDLAGKKEAVLTRERCFTYGFVADEHIYLYSEDERALIQMDLDGTETFGYYDVQMDTEYYTFAYDQGWLYYVKDGSEEIYRMRANGTGNELFVEGKDPISIGIVDDWLWILEGDGEEVSTPYLSYFIPKDNSTLLTIGDMGLPEAADGICTTSHGLLYRAEENEVTVCGYEGEKKDVAIPLMIDGMLVVEIDEASMPADCTYFLEIPQDDLEYELAASGDSVVITGYTDVISADVEYLAVPEELDGYPVTEIGDRAFIQSTFVGLYLPETVTRIGAEAFAYCENLEQISLSEGLTSIGAFAFNACLKLEAISFPESLEEIELEAFWYTGLKRVHISSGLKQIGGGAFGNVSPEFEAFTISKTNDTFTVIDGVLFTNEGRLIAYPHGKKDVTYHVPDGAVSVEALAFGRNIHLEKLTLSEDMTFIGDRAFIGCGSLYEIYIPESVSTIENMAFYQCESLTDITISKDCDYDHEDKVEVSYYGE